MKTRKYIQARLQNIAQQAIPEGVNLWPTIRAKVEKQPPSMRHARTSWSFSAVLALLGLLVVSMTAYAVYRVVIDPGMQAAEDAGLVSHPERTVHPTVFAAVPSDLAPAIPLAQSQNGINLTLEWAYADELRMGWGMTLTGLSLPQGTEPGDFICRPRVTTLEGAPLQNGTFEMQPLEGQAGHPIQLTYTKYQHLDPAQYHQLTLTVELTIGACGPRWNFNEFTDHRPGPTPTPPPLMANFNPSFSIPVYRGKVITPNQVVDAGGVAMRLEQITTTPSYTVARLCYAQPQVPVFFSDKHTEWGLSGVTLQVGQGESDRQYFGLGGEQGCLDVGFAAAIGDNPESLVIHVADLVASDNDEAALVPAFQKVAREKLDPLGIEVEFGDTPPDYWEFRRLPEGMTQTQADVNLRGLMDHTIHGPWVFEVKR
ncbi:MAG: hypothetical protein PHQ40_21890 [Anaerolineaceae bacterium]|nr:hypothetical protein [Anaerolineaceae bacterium]